MTAALSVAEYRKTWKDYARPADPDIDISTADSDMGAVSITAWAVVTDIREFDIRDLHKHLTLGCTLEPARMAQVIMALAAWVDPDESETALNTRASTITQRKDIPA
ncbi:hypothetical protein D1871_11290 [Nakamurella silvestris]|nr:hypothetical protein D1871_11290 [Nakamurella silvestris]